MVKFNWAADFNRFNPKFSNCGLLSDAGVQVHLYIAVRIGRHHGFCMMTSLLMTSRSLIKSHPTMRKVLQDDMQLSTKAPECWSSHILSAMEGLTQSYIFKQKLLNCEPIDLSRFVMDLKDRHLKFLTAQQQNVTCHQWCAMPAQRALITHLLIGFPDTCFLTFLKMSFAVAVAGSFQTSCPHPSL